MLKYAQIISYDTDKYPFSKILAAYVFRVKHINKLHLYWSKQNNGRRLGYQDNISLRNIMQKLPDDALFYKIYHQWIFDMLAVHYAHKISYSKHPKMRVHLAGTDSVSDFHRDANITKRADQINCYLPFTDVFESSSILCESN